MPSNRKLKATVLFVVLAILVTIYITSAGHQTRDSPFYTRTADALALREAEEKSGNAIKSDDVEKQRRLREAEEEAKKAANRKGAEFHGEDVKKKGEKIKDEVDRAKAIGNMDTGKPNVQKVVEEVEQSVEDQKAETELNYILKRSPIIIFSKSYCPFSKKAKNILLNKYDILPAPYVVELDLHELGTALQDQLQKNTGRRTVPNILVNGISIGGGDDVEELHNTGTLIKKIEDLVGKRVQIKAVAS